MNNQLESDAERYAEFLLAHYPAACQWEDPVSYCRWNIGHGFMAAAIGADDEVVALGVARPVERPGLGVIPYYFNENGSCLHIDLLVDTSDDERAIRALRAVTLVRFGPRKTVTMFRHDHETALKVYQYGRFWDKVLSLKKVKMKSLARGTKKEKENVTT